MLCDLPATAIVVPCYNEARRLPVNAMRDFLHRFENMHICLVNDGSTDGTADLIETVAEMCTPRVTTLHLKKNSGKAEAVRRGVLTCCRGDAFEFIGYWDADAATPFEDIVYFTDIFRRHPQVQLVMGARVKRLGARIERLWYRHYLGRLFATVASLALRMPVYDTQCGAKLFKAELARSVFEAPLLTRWIFDVELLFRVAVDSDVSIDAGIYEVPLHRWEDKTRSNLKLIHCLQAPGELYKIYARYRRPRGVRNRR